MLHKYANEDVSLGSWFIGLDAEHIDDRRLCCGTPPGKFLKFSSIKSLTVCVHMRVTRVCMSLVLLIVFLRQLFLFSSEIN